MKKNLDAQIERNIEFGAVIILMDLLSKYKTINNL